MVDNQEKLYRGWFGLTVFIGFSRSQCTESIKLNKLTYRISSILRVKNI